MASAQVSQYTTLQLHFGRLGFIGMRLHLEQWTSLRGLTEKSSSERVISSLSGTGVDMAFCF